jgi:hypothetical protein
MALENEILIDDVTCCDCGGRCEVGFTLPDQVWDGLGFPLGAFACFACMARRLNPRNPPDVDSVTEEIYRQRRKFKLKGVNRFMGIKAPAYFMRFSVEKSIKSIPKFAMLAGRNAANVTDQEWADARARAISYYGIESATSPAS